VQSAVNFQRNLLHVFWEGPILGLGPVFAEPPADYARGQG
jgi:hypothetical protein